MKKCILNRILAPSRGLRLLSIALLMISILVGGIPAFRAEAVAAGVSFKPREDYDTYLGCCVAARDFDGDGDIDLMVGGDSLLSIYKNLKNGDFDELPRTDYFTGGGICDIAAGDLDQDGDIDAALVTNVSKELITMTNSGNAVFIAKSLSLGRTPQQVEISDLNKDGQQDIIVNYGNGMEVFYGPERLAALPYTNEFSGAIAIGDLNGDGKDEVAIGSNNLGVLSNIKTGRTLYNNKISINGNLTGLVIGDFNGDGKNDIAAANSYNKKLDIFLNDGEGQNLFDNSKQYEYSCFSSPAKVFTGDLDGDGSLDIVAIDTTGSLSIFLNNGDGTFDSAGRYDFGIGQAASDVAAGDLNGDGMMDLAVIGVSGKLSIFINDKTSRQVEFKTSNYTVKEGDVSATVYVTRSNGKGDMAVDYSATDGTATAGSDYTAASGTLNFKDGVTEQWFRVKINEDTLSEGTEQLNLSLSNPSNGYNLGRLKTATITIADNDKAGEKTETSNPPAAIDSKFTDIENHWAKNDILFLVNKGIVSGVTPTTFEPERTITRAEFSTLVVKALDLKGSPTGSGTFKDVAPGDWYFNAVETATQFGLLSGVGEGRFEPNRTISRQEMAVLVVRAREKFTAKSESLALEEIDQLLAGIIDAGNISPWAREGVAKALKLGMINIWPTEGFDPSAGATRAMSAAAIAKIFV